MIDHKPLMCTIALKLWTATTILTKMMTSSRSTKKYRSNNSFQRVKDVETHSFRQASPTLETRVMPTRFSRPSSSCQTCRVRFWITSLRQMIYWKSLKTRTWIAKIKSNLSSRRFSSMSCESSMLPCWSPTRSIKILHLSYTVLSMMMPTRL